jgi:endonuclease YncB( thermonuclease family)
MCGRLLAGMALILFAILSYTAGPRGGSVAAAEITAEVSVIDGDTLQVGDKVLNLFGIDAPELGQLCRHDDRWNRCGISAAFELKKLLKFDKPLRCEPAPADRRKVICHASSVDVALVLLKAGYAVAELGSGSAYQEAEKSAREGNLGLWHMAFVSPWDWRHGRRLPGSNEAEEATCPIKAIIDGSGRKLYYVPTDEVYKKIAVDLSKGDRRFCSDVAVRQAGWRRLGEAG